jgi:outer membrane protein assembly factor BamA
LRLYFNFFTTQSIIILKNNFVIKLLPLLIALLPLQLAAQDSLRNQLDMIDVFHKITKKQLERADTNEVHLSVLPAAGYSTATGFAVLLTAQAVFYNSKHHLPDDKLSNILTSLTYSQYNQIIFPIQASIWAKNNKYNIITDWRYLKYPSSTFGLGGHTNINNGYTIDFNYVKIHQAVLRSVFKNLYAGIGYYYDHFWNVRQVNVPPDVITDFQKYGLTSTVTSSGIALRLLYDSRSNPINPSNGWFGSLVYRPNFTFLGSDSNWQSLLIELRKYVPFPAGSKNVLAFWSYNWLTIAGKPPYLLLPSTGWDDFYNTGRGYVQGRYRGRNMVYLESEYRFGITQNGLIGGVVFVNAESFSKDISQQLDFIAPGYGAGIRIKLNKFSGANLCIDYGFGIQGSHGVSVNLGEVF